MAITDQFEVFPTATFSGSSIADVPFGDFAATGFSIRQNKRLLMTNQVERNPTEYINQSYVPTWVVEGFASGSHLGRPQKFNRHFAATEFYFDSLVPNPLDIHLKTADKLILWVSDLGATGSERWGVNSIEDAADFPGEGGIMQMWQGVETLNGTYPADSVDTEWYLRHPFESKYKGIERLISFNGRFPQKYDLATDINGNAVSPVTSSNLLAGCGFTLPASVLFQLGWMHYGENSYPSFDFANNAGTVAPRDYYNLFFGIGDGDLPNLTYRKGPRVKAFFFFVLYSYAIEIRGFKYGLYNTTRTRTSNVFRFNRFGQFRDMLEQRPVTKFFDRTKNTTVRSPVIVRFVSGTTTYERSVDYVTASAPDYNTTDSGIYDLEYKAGQPFYDDRS